MKKAEKKSIFYDETNIDGACMSGKFMTKTEEQKTATFITKYKASKKIKQAKKLFQKVAS